MLARNLLRKYRIRIRDIAASVEITQTATSSILNGQVPYGWAESHVGSAGKRLDRAQRDIKNYLLTVEGVPEKEVMVAEFAEAPTPKPIEVTMIEPSKTRQQVNQTHITMQIVRKIELELPKLHQPCKMDLMCALESSMSREEWKYFTDVWSNLLNNGVIVEKTKGHLFWYELGDK